MKTTDLIPIILYQLVDGDKYGYEIVKQIEDSSNGGLVIKQPTLYSVLKKLEQGRFISSYWQDSEIGGKRHYYKLTDNGKAQLDTYPPFEDLIKDALESEGFVYPTIKEPNTELSQPSPSPTLIEQNESITTQSSAQPLFNEENENTLQNIDEVEIKPITIDLTTPIELNTFKLGSDEIEIKPIDLNFTSSNNNSVDSSYNEIKFEMPNEQDTVKSSSYHNIFDAIDYDDSSLQTSDYATTSPIEDNEINQSDVATTQSSEKEDNNPKFTEKVENIETPYVVNKLYDKLTPSEDLIAEVSVNTNADESIFSPSEPIDKIKYINYVDFSTDKAVINHKKIINKHIQKMAMTCFTLLVMLVCSIIICSKHSFSKLYYISALIVCLIIILYPLTLLSEIPKIRLKYCSSPFKYSISRDFFIKLSLFLSLIITIFAYNLTLVNSINDIFEINNFANLFAPLMFSAVAILDFVYNVIFYKKYTK